MSRRCPAAARPSKTVTGSWRLREQNVPGDGDTHDVSRLQSRLRACVIKRGRTGQITQSVCAVSQPPCGGPGSCGGGGGVLEDSLNVIR